MKIEKVVFTQTNRSFDFSGPIKLATFRVFIYSKMEHKVSKQNLWKSIYQWNAQDLTNNKMRLFSQYDDQERNYKLVNDTSFSLILSEAILLIIMLFFRKRFISKSTTQFCSCFDVTKIVSE